ncbi:MAG: isochorismatase family protein [Thaumarchaeota archaeon]|nr:isochorismatase family protein [Nitrososphaerota archaeon]
MSIWDDVIGERDRQVLAAGGYVKPLGLTGPGERPAVLVIDVVIDLVGDKPEPILESIKRFPRSCGDTGWEAVYRIKELLDVARMKRVPVIYSKEEQGTGIDCWRHEASSHHHDTSKEQQIPQAIQPLPEDIVINKRKTSVFFGTPLMSYLNFLRVDTLIVTGGITSGCVRATVTDAYAYNFKVVLVEECIFDRAEISHKVNLFEMHQKYGDLATVDQVAAYLKGIPSASTSSVSDRESNLQ